MCDFAPVVVVLAFATPSPPPAPPFPVSFPYNIRLAPPVQMFDEEVLKAAAIRKYGEAGFRWDVGCAGKMSNLTKPSLSLAGG